MGTPEQIYASLRRWAENSEPGSEIARINECLEARNKPADDLVRSLAESQDHLRAHIKTILPYIAAGLLAGPQLMIAVEVAARGR